MTLLVLQTHSGSELTAVLSSLQALSELHSAHIAHLDVKGDNVMLPQNFNCTWDTLRLIDFAMAAKSSPGGFFLCTNLSKKHVGNLQISCTSVQKITQVVSCASLWMVFCRWCVPRCFAPRARLWCLGS